MFDLLKKVMHAGIGGAALAADKVHEGIEELIKKGEITEKEGKELLDGYVSKVKEESEKLKKQIDEAVTDRIEKIAVASKTEVDELKKTVQDLKERITALEEGKFPYAD